MVSAEEHSIEIIDLSLPQSDIARAIRKSCIDIGFFYIVNHGVEHELISNVFKQSRRFFELPLEEKMKNVQDQNNRGYTPFMEQKLDPKNQTKGDTKEGFYIGLEIDSEDDRAKLPLHGPNNWPSPDVLPGWRETMMTYHDEMMQLSFRLLRFFALSLNLPESYFLDSQRVDCPMLFLRLLHYNDEKSCPDEGIFGAGAHSDYGLFTLLMTDEKKGLQVCKNKDSKNMIWENVLPVPNAFIVNIGDMMERWTNHLFRSTLHRVISVEGERYSIPLFFDADFNCIIDCLPTCYDDENPPMYEPITAGEYLLGRYKFTHSNFDNINLKKL